MSGEATPRAQVDPGALERAFGDRARCNACGVEVERYRVIALFLHDLAAVRAYCGGCYEAACDGVYHARGDGMLIDYHGFASRFGAPGPPPPPASRVDRMLGALLRDARLRRLAPPSEALARRARCIPYRFASEWLIGDRKSDAELVLRPDGAVERLAGDPAACAAVRAALGLPG
jgi:hypothetical protein